MLLSTSVINHKIRKQFNLSNNEYIFLDFIFLTNKVHSHPITYGMFDAGAGLSINEVKKLFASMKERKFLVWDQIKKRTDVSVEWKVAFDTSNQFDELWKIHPKGNKNMARERLPKVLKKIDFNQLKIKLQKYLSDCRNTQRFEKDLATWMNPKNEHWNDIMEKKAAQTVSKIIFKKKE